MKNFTDKNKKRPFSPGGGFKPRAKFGKDAPYDRPARGKFDDERSDRGPSKGPGGYPKRKEQGPGQRSGGFSRSNNSGTEQGGGGGFSRYREQGPGPRPGEFQRKNEGGPRGGESSYGKPAWKDSKPDYKGGKPAWKDSKPSWKKPGAPGRSFDGPRYNERPRYNDRPDAAERTGDRPAWKKDRPSYNPGPGGKPRKSYQPGSPGGQREWNRPAGGPQKYGSGPSRPQNRYNDRPSGPSERPYARKEQRPADTFDRPPVRPVEPKPKTFTAGAFLKKGDFPTAKTLVLNTGDKGLAMPRPVLIYENMISALPEGTPGAGSTVLVHDEQGQFLGSAVFNPEAPVRARVFSVARRKFDEEYIREALKNAVDRRRRQGLLGGSCRLVYGESDGLPGLTADKIGDFVVIHPVTVSISQHLPFIIDRLNELAAPEGIVVRRDQLARTKEGLTTGPPEIHGTVPERVTVKESGVTLYANILTGHPSGLALDHRLNRGVIKPYCTADARVLDLFCHVGAWALHAGRYGAGEVIGVESSHAAIEMARAGAEASRMEDRVSFVEDDVFEYLNAMEPGRLFDVIICDPPAFARTRQHKEEALRAYVSLNYLAMKKLKPGGVLVTCTSSKALSGDEFSEALATAARNVQMNLQLLQRRGAAADHPALPGLPETEAVKCFVLERTE